jgi:tetratricopeptide (TPR) repeat protein
MIFRARRCGQRGLCAFLAAFLAALVAACATTQTAELLRAPPPDLPKSAHLSTVPAIRGDAASGAAAALAMALHATGAPARVEDLLPRIVLFEGQADLRPAIAAAAMRHGRLVFQLAAKLDDVLAEIADGRPVLVRLVGDDEIGLAASFAVARGYDLERGEIVLNTPRRELEPMPLAVFERDWWRAGNWAIVIDRPDRLPRTATADRLAAAALALERFDPAAAQLAYDAIARRALALRAWMEIGGGALREGRAAEAVMAYANASRIDPANAAAWAGQAEALLGANRLDEAAAAARRALTLAGPGGARSEEHAALLDRIEAARRARLR